MIRNKQSLFSLIVLVLVAGIFVARADFVGPPGPSGPPSGDGLLSVSGSTLEVDGGSGKITAGTIDPLYTIDGSKYATFMAGMIGLKEETTGLLLIPGATTIDFRNQPVGSDLWVFAKITDLERNFDKMVVNLTPSFNGNVWYEKDAENLHLTLRSDQYGEVSYRLTAPRFDWQQWPTQTIDTADGLVIDTDLDGKMRWDSN